jgi:hypothetical protein
MAALHRPDEATSSWFVLFFEEVSAGFPITVGHSRRISPLLTHNVNPAADNDLYIPFCPRGMPGSGGLRRT